MEVVEIAMEQWNDGNLPLSIDENSGDTALNITLADELQRRLQPRTREDFRTLNSELIRWRGDEWANSSKTKSEALTILWKETKLIQKIQYLRQNLEEKRSGYRFQKQIQTLTNPVLWKLSDGHEIEVHRPIMEYARTLKNLESVLLSCYSSKLGVEQKLKNWSIVKDALAVLDTSRSRELMDLIHRQIEWTSHGRSCSTELRNRTRHVFMQLLEEELGITNSRMKKKSKLVSR